MTGDNSLYKYVSPEAPRQKINYSYAKFGGVAFLNDYKKSRKAALIHLDQKVIFKGLSQNTTATEVLFNKWINIIQKGQAINENELLLLIKRFEVTKKIYETYDTNFRPIDKGKYLNFDLYVLFAEVLALVYGQHARLQYLNALLKVNDINIGILHLLSNQLKKKTAYYVRLELEFIDELKKKLSE